MGTTFVNSREGSCALSFLRYSRNSHAYPGVLVSSASWWDLRNQRKGRFLFPFPGILTFECDELGESSGNWHRLTALRRASSARDCRFVILRFVGARFGV